MKIKSMKLEIKKKREKDNLKKSLIIKMKKIKKLYIYIYKII